MKKIKTYAVDHTKTLHREMESEGETCDGAMNDGTVLELDRDGLVVQLHQKPAHFFTSKPRNHTSETQKKSTRGWSEGC